MAARVLMTLTQTKIGIDMFLLLGPVTISSEPVCLRALHQVHAKWETPLIIAILECGCIGGRVG